jgi:Ca-activated chloride channel family protein
MQLNLETYESPEGEKYFRLEIVPGPKANQMKVIPKEIIFLMDASLSIQQKRLGEVVRGIQESLKHLNPQDKFNVYTFKDRIVKMSEESMTVSDAAIRDSVRLLSKLEPTEQTDIYKAFRDSIQTRASMNPSYIIFFSDGRPTQGVVSSEKLIGEISRINHLERSIFAFSGGKRVNRYLLDFLAYQNRGWSEYAEETHMISERIFGLYQKIQNPLLTNLRYQFSNLSEAEVYPKHLPDFYLNTRFVLYGQYTNEDAFSVRVVGDADGESKDFLYTRRLSAAPKGSEAIAREWAFNKFYHRISTITLEGKTPEGTAELKRLSDQFKIKTPYDL